MVQQRQRLHRSRDDRLLFGVAGGLAEFLDVDPVLVRIGWILLTLATVGIAVLAYIVLAVITSNGRQPVSREVGKVNDSSSDISDSVVEPGPAEEPPRRQLARNVLGVGLIVVGMIVLLGNLGVFDSIRWDIVWPVVIMVLGLTILLPSIPFRR